MPSTMAMDVKPWRLGKVVDPRLHKVARKIENTWIANGAVQDAAFDKRYGWCSQEGMTLENRMYRHRAFSSMHLELACVQTGKNVEESRSSVYHEGTETVYPVEQSDLQVLHCLAMPHPCYALPIFGADVVIRRGVWTLCVADTSPTEDRLPPTYAAKVESLQRSILPTRQDGQNKGRRVPAWATKIFSPLCISIRPDSKEEVQAFVDYILQLHATHINYAQGLIEGGRVPSWAGEEVRRQAMQQYNKCQKENDKTRSVLARYFGDQFAEEYISQVLFSDKEITLG